MRAILIDPENKRVTEVQIPGGDETTGAAINKLIGSDLFCSGHYFDNNDTIYCDDEGLLGEELPMMFRIGMEGQPIPGKGLVVGADEGGNSVDAKTSVGEITEKVRWMIPMDRGGRIVVDILNGGEEV